MASIVALLGGFAAFAFTRERQLAKINELDRQGAETRKDVEKLQDSYSSLKDRFSSLEGQHTLVLEALTSLRADVAALGKESRDDMNNLRTMLLRGMKRSPDE